MNNSRLASADAACPAVNFHAARNFPVGKDPNYIAAGDFNGDGIPDLAVANSSLDVPLSKDVAILRGDGTGSFSPTHRLKIVANTEPGFIAVGDFNSDGKSDLAITAVSYADVSVLLSNGNGGFNQPVTVTAGLKPRFIIVRDFNGDGKSDLAVANLESNNISLLFGDGSGGFASPKNISLYHTPGALEAGDFNGDGKTDLIAVMPQSELTTMLLGDGAGNFNALPTFYAGSHLVKVADFNSDGLADIVTVQANGVFMSVRLGNGAGGFTSVKEFNWLTPTGLVVGDFNGDGKADFAVSSSAYNEVMVLLGDGAANFSLTKFAAGSSPAGIATADFNLDGKPDFGVVNAKSNDVSVMLGKGGGDFNAARSLPAGQSPRNTGEKDPISIATAHFNQDASPDLAVVNFASRNVSILLNNGSGVFNLAVRYDAGFAPKHIVVADLNSDNKMDMAIAQASGNAVIMLLGNGDGSFIYAAGRGEPWDVPLNGATYVACGDVNSDGKIDLAIISQGQLRIALSTGRGFHLPSAGFNVGANPVSISLGDLNSDGKLDFVVANADEISGANNDGLLIAFGNGAGGVSSTRLQAAGSDPRYSLVRDFNGDGKLDVAVTTQYGSSEAGVSVLLGDGAGNFAPARNFEVGLSPYGIAAADFNADGRLDLAVTSLYLNRVGVLLADGAGNFAPAIGTGVGAEPRSLVAADFNDDGKADVVTANFFSTDITTLLSVPCINPTPTPTPSPSPTPIPNSPPVLLTMENSERAVALDSVTFMRDPFPVATTRNLSPDGRTRIMLFATNLELTPGESNSVITAQAEDSLGRVFPLVVEYSGRVPGIERITQVNVRLAEGLADAGDVWVSINMRGVPSNKGLISIAPSR